MTIYTFIFFCAGNLHCFICGVVCYKNNCLNGGVDTILIIKRLHCNISLVVLLELYEVLSSNVFYYFRSKVKCAYKPSDASRPWQTRTHCCGHIVADTNVSPFARARNNARNICCGHKFCVRDTKNVSDFVQKHFLSATNVSQFAQPKKHHGQQCVRNNVSSFTRAFRPAPVSVA